MAFVVFEGLDGSGKSTLIRELEVFLKQKKISFITTREPGGTLLGEKIRTLILNPETQSASPSLRCEALLYQAIRAQHVEEVIKPALKSGKWVISDRFSISSLAFQGFGRNLPLDDIFWLNHFSTEGLAPELTVFLDISVVEAQARVQKRSMETDEPLDRLESEASDFHQRVAQGYKDIFMKSSLDHLILKGECSRDELRENLIGRVRETFFNE